MLYSVHYGFFVYMILSGTALAKTMNETTSKKVDTLKNNGILPKLAVILVGNDSASRLYIQKKQEAAEKIGIDFALYEFPDTISQESLEKEIQHIQKTDNISGLIIQLPVPENFYPTVLNAVDPAFDVDCLTHTNLGKLVMKTHTMMPPTPGAVMILLKETNIPLRGKTVVIVGMGILVGKPLSIILMNEGATVIVCNSATKNLAQYTKHADIIITGVGKKHIITKDMVGTNQIIIDAGVDFVNNQMFGDVDFEAIAPDAAYITPTPGGVGPLTVAQLLLNTVIAAEELKK